MDVIISVAAVERNVTVCICGVDRNIVCIAWVDVTDVEVDVCTDVETVGNSIVEVEVLWHDNPSLSFKWQMISYSCTLSFSKASMWVLLQELMSICASVI